MVLLWLLVSALPRMLRFELGVKAAVSEESVETPREPTVVFEKLPSLIKFSLCPSSFISVDGDKNVSFGIPVSARREFS